MAKLRAVLFEKPTVYWNDQKMIFPFAKMEALLYYLLITGEATREELAALLWGDMGDHAAKRNLRNTVYMLKKMFSVDLLITSSRAKIALNPDIVTETNLELMTVTDIVSFLKKNPGEFLGGFYCKDAASFDEWVTEKREQFRMDSINHLTKYIIKLINQKEYMLAKKYLKQLIGMDAYNESAYRVLMKIYEKEDSYKAMEIYQDLERKMAQDLSLLPSPKTQELYRRIKNRKSSRTIEEGAVSNQKFFGREKELLQLRLWMDDFYHKGHSKQMILLQGDQGVGKSAIVEQLFASIPIKHSNIFRTQCYQAEYEYLYKAWNNIFLQVMSCLMQADIHLPLLWQQVIAYVFPTTKISETLLHKEITVDAYKFSATMVEEIMCEVLGKAAHLKKTILVIEDIHWMDKQGWLLLWQVLRIHGKHILCIATCHAEYLQQIDKTTEEFERSNMLEHLEIGRFSAHDVRKLSASRLPDISKEMQSRLYDYTGGNALFLIECLNLIAAGRDISHGSIRLNSVLKERTGNVSDNARKILEIASVFFSNVNYVVLQAISQINEFDLVEVLEELQQKQLLMEELEADRGGAAYKFYNLQIRNYVYNQMSTIRQRMFHKQAASYLEQQLQDGMQSKDVYEHILYHYTNADEKLKMLDYTIKLTEKYFCPQYEMFPELNRYYPTGYVDFRESRSQITIYLEKIKELLDVLVHSKMANKRLDAYKVAYWEMSGRYHIWRGEHLLGLKLIHQMLRLASVQKLREYQIKGYQQIIYCGIQTRRAYLIREFALKLLHLTEHDELPDKKATALRFLGIACALKGQYQEAENYYRQSLALFKKLTARNRFYAFTIAAAQNYIGDLRRENSDYQAALHHYEQAVRIAGRKNISEGVALFYINAGYTAFQINNYVKAIAYLKEALSVAEGFGDQKGYWCLRGYCTLNCVLALIAVRQNRPYEARIYFEQAKDFLKKYNDQYQNGLIFRTQAEIKLLMKEDAKVAEVFEEDLPLPAVAYYQQARKVFDKMGMAVELKSLEDMMSEYNCKR
ncbi:tetratricopeptide repeat protein [Pelosinus propionicus]|uniref:DNA-binding transcriptional activator of the SARP family n=1 Tax=Pelosinus propionicus DSM 13327 TaxID=1123291 RepID=A0A1I4IU88_9FIRM|nr:tetratricopeptide repeat protein [Pelosinus propionicus]SFL57401.1 DNA-binding transcriptional activator of the SARP family [Pelosinus propionicus DSM 13327]